MPRSNRVTLFNRHNGQCYWCECTTVLHDPPFPNGRPPDETATIDHLLNRVYRKNPGDNLLKVLACFRCNQNRAFGDVRYGENGAEPIHSMEQIDDLRRKYLDWLESHDKQLTSDNRVLTRRQQRKAEVLDIQKRRLLWTPRTVQRGSYGLLSPTEFRLMQEKWCEVVE